MANEIANRSHAGFVLEAHDDGDPVLVDGSWGIDASSLVKLGTGLYSVRLTRPIGAVFNAAGNGFTVKEGFPIASAEFAASGLASAILAPDIAPVAGEPLQFTQVQVTTTDFVGIPVDNNQTINVEVLRAPED